MTANPTIAIGQKFAFASMREASVLLRETMPLASGFWLSPTPPVDVGSVWAKWLGTLRVEEVAKANIFIVSVKQSIRPEVLDNENEVLEAAVQRFFFGMLFVGVPQYLASSLLSGANVDGVPNVRQFGDLGEYYIAHGGQPHAFDWPDFERAWLISESLRSVSEDLPHYQRLRRGINAYLKALREASTYDRIHQLVRALEALILPAKSKTTKEFRTRCQLFSGETHGAATVLGEAYELRSRVEHLRDWDDVLPVATEDERYEEFSHRVRQLEALARFAYARILTTPALMGHFETSLSLEKFWNLGSDARKALWGEQLDITVVS